MKKLLLGSMAVVGFALGFYTAVPANAAESPSAEPAESSEAIESTEAVQSAEPASCSPKGHKCAKNFDCCSKMCWKSSCT